MNKPLLDVLDGVAQKPAAGLADAAGRPLSAGISRAAGKGRRLSRSHLHAGARGRGDAAADPPVRLRCRDPVLGYSGRFPMRSASRCGLRPAKDRGSSHSRAPQASSGWPARSTRRCLAPIYETVRLVKAKLAPGTALLGFCGAPWTVASYMIAGQGTPDQAPARLFAYREPAAFAALIDILVEASAAYLVRQLQAGADAVQIFDTWAACCRPRNSRAGASSRRGKIVAKVRAQVPGAKVIGFPRGAGTLLARYVEEIAGRCGRSRLDRRSRLCARAGAEPRAGAGQSRSAGAGGGRGGARSGGRCGARGVCGPAVHLQSRPRHRAGDADRPCRAHARRIRGK